MPASAWAENPGGLLAELNHGQPLTPAQVLAVYQAAKAQQTGGQGSPIDGLGGFVNSATGGLVSFGNPNTARYERALLEKEYGMSINSALVGIRPAAAIASDPGIDVIAVIRRLVARARCPQAQPFFNVGGSYRIPDGRRGYERVSNWVHSHH